MEIPALLQVSLSYGLSHFHLQFFWGLFQYYVIYSNREESLRLTLLCMHRHKNLPVLIPTPFATVLTIKINFTPHGQCSEGASGTGATSQPNLPKGWLTAPGTAAQVKGERKLPGCTNRIREFSRREALRLLFSAEEFKRKISLTVSSYGSSVIIGVSPQENIPGAAAPSAFRKASVPLCSKGKQVTRPFRAGWCGSETPSNII